jgi:hypothetical protein
MALGILLTTSACTVVARDGHYHGGPPPHAPAHGYRYHYDDLDLVFDTALGIYLVFGYPYYYWYDNWYYHWDGDHWHRSKHFKRGWKHIDHDHVPRKLYRKYYRKDLRRDRDYWNHQHDRRDRFRDNHRDLRRRPYDRRDNDRDRDRRGDRDGDRDRDRRGDRDGDRDRDRDRYRN